MDVTFATAQRHINRLEAAGLVREITGQSRNRVYRADEGYCDKCDAVTRFSGCYMGRF